LMENAFLFIKTTNQAKDNYPSNAFRKINDVFLFNSHKRKMVLKKLIKQ